MLQPLALSVDGVFKAALNALLAVSSDESLPCMGGSLMDDGHGSLDQAQGIHGIDRAGGLILSCRHPIEQSKDDQQ